MIQLQPLRADDRERFITENQRAFQYGALEEFGKRDDHAKEGEEIISRKTIGDAIDSGIALRIVEDGKAIGGVVVKAEGEHGELELLFVSPEAHSRGVGYAAWQAIEKRFPEVKLWETCTPYFETRNIHFYVNKCGFHIVEFFNGKHPDPHDPAAERESGLSEEDYDGMFRLEKRLP